MPRITLGYAAKKYDRWGGRNFFNNSLMFNFSGQFGSSDDLAARFQNPGAESDIVIDRFSFARFQKIGGGRWTLFMRVNGQISNDSLPSSLYKSLGGANSVRGFRDRVHVGDYGFDASVELRTPLLENFIPGMVRDEEYMKQNPDDWAMNRLQGVVFYDLGWAAFHEPLPGQLDDITFQSLGLGFRLGFTKYSQIRFDYGFPIDEGPDISSAGRAHVTIQLQY